MPYQPGDRVDWRDLDNPDPDQRFWRPGTADITCCQASVGGGFVVVIDEAGLGHNLTEGRVRPRADPTDTRDFAPLPAAPRPKE